MKLLRRLDAHALDLLYPDGAVCLLCGRVSGGEPLCPDCAGELEQSRLDKDSQTDRRRSVWQHNSPAGQLVRLLKDHAIHSAADILAKGIAETAGEIELPADTVVTSVPMPFRRYLERAIDHGRTLARCAAEQMGMPSEMLMRRQKGSTRKTQRGQNRQQRQENLKDAFEPAVSVVPPHILLVDDVMTTGATADACEKCLMDAGAEKVWVVTATRA